MKTKNFHPTTPPMAESRVVVERERESISLTKQMATMIQNAMKNLWMMGVFLSYSLWSQIPAGTDAQHATAILLNTDSVYSQNRSQGWFSFTTSSVSSVSGNVINLKTVVIRDPVSSTTVKIRVVNLYDNGLNLLVSDTLHSGDTALVFTASVSANQSYYIQTIANYPCDSCVYNEAVSFGMQILAPFPPPINLCGFCANTLSGVLTTSPPPNQSYCINNDIYIFTSINFTSSEFKINPGVKIVVGNGGILTINNSHLYTCSGMWRGIIVYDPASNGASSGRVFIQNNSLIEDANVAVSFPYGNTNISSNFFGCFEAVLNKNDTGIVLRNYFPSGTGVPMPYGFGINRTIITCRKIPYNQTPPFVPSSAYYSNVKATASNVGVPYASPYINNVTYPFTTTRLGQNAKIGIYLFKVGIIPTPGTFYEVQIGSTVGFSDMPYINIFDNMEYDIYAVMSNFTCINNVFQNGNTNSVGQVGIGIYANAGRIGNHRINVRPFILPGLISPGSGYWGIGVNRFYDLSRAIQVEDYIYQNLINNDIRSSQVNTLPTLPPAYHKGEYGILIKTNRFHKSVIEYNTIFNVENGIIYHCTFGTMNIPGITPGVVTNAQYSGQIRIDSNFIQPNIPYTPITTQYVSNAVYLSNTLPYGNYYSNPSLSISTSSNSIHDVYRGIYVGSFHNKVVTTNKNCITLSNEISAVSNPIQYGILREFMQGNVSLSNQIISNNITGTGVSNPNMSGIYIRGSSFENVRCNSVSKVANGIVFDKCPQTCGFIGNTITTYAKGYTLKNTSVIGPQGASGSPSDNVFGPVLCNPFYKTYVDNANPFFSPLYVRSTPPSFNPQGCGGTFVFGSPYYDNILYPGTLIYTTGPINLPCANNPYFPTCGPWIVPTPIAPPPSGTLFPNIPPVNNPILLMEKIAQNQIPLLPFETWTKKNAVFRGIVYEPSIQSNSSVLNNFYNSNYSSSYKQILDIESELFNGNYATAQSQLSTISSQNIFEHNFKTYYQIYLNYAINNSISVNDSISLYTLASSCSMLNGDAVFLARALYNAYYDKMIIWNDDCMPVINGQRTAGTGMNINYSETSNSEFLIYPNPAKDEIVIANFSRQGVQSVKIYDLSGKEIMDVPISAAVTFPYRMKLNLLPGFYMIEIVTENNMRYTHKILIER